jgi:hypothetical protein
MRGEGIFTFLKLFYEDFNDGLLVATLPRIQDTW